MRVDIPNNAIRLLYCPDDDCSFSNSRGCTDNPNTVVYAPIPNALSGISKLNSVIVAYGPFKTELHDDPVMEQRELTNDEEDGDENNLS